MSFSISNFEAEIDPTILERGQIIWGQGMLGDLEEMGDKRATPALPGSSL